MNAIICDRCADITDTYSNFATIQFNGPLIVGEEEEIHLCPACGKALRLWIAGKVENDDRSNSEITF